MSGPNPGSATSAAKMNLRSGVTDPGIKIYVEHGRKVSSNELKRDAENGSNYFWNNPEKPWRYANRPIEKRRY